MKRKTKVLVIGAVSALIIIVGSWFLSRALVGTGSGLWVLRAGLTTLGLVAVGLAVWYFLKRIAAEAADEPATGPDDIDVAVAAARERLAAAKLAGGGSLGSLPLVVVMGPGGAAKTTTVVRSGLEAELLAGELAQGDALLPTRAANLWYAGGTILVEAGGPVAADQSRWARLVRHLHPQRLSAVFAGGVQAPRAALVCFSCEDLLRPGSSESVLAAARVLRARLGELAEQLGIRLPVYVFFTKVDRVPYFAEYVHNFSREETQQVLGATLDAELEAPIGSYADRESGRVTDAFSGIIRSLSDKRLLVLSREHAPERRPGAYEFPRELRKLVPTATQFLVDLCKPSQLQASPFLRGFYFTGVQAVVVTETMPSPMAQPAAKAAAGIGATSVFQSRAATAAPPMPLAAPTSRKVPRWVFLDRLFRDVILADRAASDVTRGGTKVTLLRRVALGSGVAAAVLLSLAFTTSFVRNSGLRNGVVGAAEAVAAVPASASELPSLDALQRLDSLRARVAVLRDHASDGTPLSFRWGLYRGDELLDPARATYFANFDRLIFDATRRAMVSELAALPDAPRAGDEYAANYDLLKAYLITTSHPQHSTVDSLPPVLMRSWLAGRPLEPERAELAQRQMAFYASELLVGNPLATDPEPATVQHARAFLGKFSGAENIYQFMLDEAAKTNQPVRFPAAAGGSPPALADGYEVPPAFTKNGWTFVQGAIAGVVERFFSREPWVMGDQSAAPGDSLGIVRELRARYIADYQRHWRAFLRAASVAGFANIPDAGRKLTVLSGNQSPMLTLLSLVAEHTNVDSVTIRPAFQPVHLVTPPGVTDMLIGPGNKPYMDALVNLASAVDLAAKAAAGNDGEARANIASTAAGALVATRQVAQNFRRDAQGGTETMTLVQSLMEAPINQAERLTRATGTSALNAAGGAFCGPFQELMAKFPFDPGSAVNAEFSEIAAIFQPPDGSLHRYYRGSLERALVRQGDTWVPRPGAQIQLSDDFIRFFNRAMAISQAFYRDNSTNPRIPFTFRPIFSANIEWVTLTIDGIPQRFNKGDVTARSFTWNGPFATGATLSARAGRTEGTVETFTGPWALFRLIHEVEGWAGSGGTYAPVWLLRINGREVRHDDAEVQLRAELNLGSTPPIFYGAYFSGLTCVPQVAR